MAFVAGDRAADAVVCWRAPTTHSSSRKVWAADTSGLDGARLLHLCMQGDGSLAKLQQRER